MEKFRILVMEDDATDWLLLEHQIGKMGEDVCAQRVTTLREALEALSGGHHDVMLTDLYVPDSRGLDTFHQIRNQSPDLPILILSSLDDERLTKQALSKGADDYFVKGKINATLLERSMRYAIECRRLKAEIYRLERENRELRMRSLDPSTPH